MSACACCSNGKPPAKYEMEDFSPLASTQFDEGQHLDIRSPDLIKYLNPDMNYSSDFVNELPSNYGCCSSFKIVNDSGMDIIEDVLKSIGKYAVSSPRIPKVMRGGTFRSKFLNDLAHSQSILKMVSSMSNCEMIYHPMKIQQLHLNMNPDSNMNPDNDELENNHQKKKQKTSKQIDKWHFDTTGFVIVLFCTHHTSYEGGQLQYFNGTTQEGTNLIKEARSDNEALANLRTRVNNVGLQKRGYGVFMQGSRIFHQVSPLIRGRERNTLVFSFQPRNVLALEACDRLTKTYNCVDPLHILLPDWVRYRAWKILRRMEIYQDFRAKSVPSVDDDCSSIHDDGNDSNGIGESKMALALSTELDCVVESCKANMQTLMKTVPYTKDKAILMQQMSAAIDGLNTHLRSRGAIGSGQVDIGTVTSDATANADANEVASDRRDSYDINGHNIRIKKYKNEHDKYCTTNLKDAVADAERCIADILEIKEEESVMVFVE